MKVVDKKDYSKDLNIPKKSIIIDGDFNKRESFFVEKMQEGSKYQEAKEINLQKQINVNISSIPFDIARKLVPTNIINIVLKDIIARYSIINGYNVNSSIGFFHTDEMLKDVNASDEINYYFENNLQKNIISQNNTGIIEKNRIRLESNIKRQIFEIMNLGVMINYNSHYFSTLRKDTSTKMLNKFESLYKSGRIKHEIRPITWCTKCGESAKNDKIAYKKSKVANSYILFKIKNDKEKLTNIVPITNTYIVAATIRPWTLIYDYSLVVAKNTEYALIQVENVNSTVTRYIMAKELADKVMQDGFFLKYSIVKTFSSDVLDGIVLANPLNEVQNINIYSIDRKMVMIDKNNLTGINVLSNADTYLDYMILKEIGNADLKCILDKNGIVNNLVPKYKGKHYKEVNKEVIDTLKKSNSIFLQTNTIMIIPRCKTCNEEIIYRDLNKWFLVRDESENETLKKCFGELKEKIIDGVTNSQDYLNISLDKILKLKELDISDQRQCNVPIPAFSCASCGNIIINDKTIEICKNIILNDGIDSYHNMSPDEILKGSVKCPICDCDFLFKDDNNINDNFKMLTLPMFNIEKDIKHPEYKAKVNINLCIESRKSFLKKLKVITFDDNAAAKLNLITQVMLHPQTREEKSKKESDFLFNPKFGNDFSNSIIKTDVEIIDIINKYGIDVLRLWAIYRSNKQSMKLSEGDIINTRNIYVKFRKTVKYIISNLYDFEPTKDFIKIEERDHLDKYIYEKMRKLEIKLSTYYSKLNFRGVYKTLFVFCVNMLQENYFEAIRYRLYITKSSGFLRRSTQSTLYEIFEFLLTYLFPILPLLFEECFPFLQQGNEEIRKNSLLFRKKGNLKEIEITSKELDWEKIFNIRKKVIPYVNKACNEGIIKNSFAASVTICCNQEGIDFINNNYENIVRTLNISEILAKFGEKFEVTVKKASGVACARCRNYSVDIGINYKYRYLCPICAEIEENMDKNSYIQKATLKRPKISEKTVQEDTEIYIPPPKFEDEIDTNFDVDRLGGNFGDDEYKLPSQEEVQKQNELIKKKKEEEKNKEKDKNNNFKQHIITNLQDINKDIQTPSKDSKYISVEPSQKTQFTIVSNDKTTDSSSYKEAKDAFNVSFDTTFDDDRLGSSFGDDFNIHDEETEKNEEQNLSGFSDDKKDMNNINDKNNTQDLKSDTINNKTKQNVKKDETKEKNNTTNDLLKKNMEINQTNSSKINSENNVAKEKEKTNDNRKIANENTSSIWDDTPLNKKNKTSLLNVLRKRDNKNTYNKKNSDNNEKNESKEKNKELSKDTDNNHDNNIKTVDIRQNELNNTNDIKEDVSYFEDSFRD